MTRVRSVLMVKAWFVEMDKHVTTTPSFLRAPDSCGIEVRAMRSSRKIGLRERQVVSSSLMGRHSLASSSIVVSLAVRSLSVVHARNMSICLLQ